MKILLVLSLIAACSLSPIVKAQNLKTQINQSFLVDSNFDFGGKVYFNCSSLENQFSVLLKTLGATDVKVTCNGGFTQGLPPIAWEANVKVSYTAVDNDDNSQSNFKAVKLNQSESCFLMTQLFRQVEHSFTFKNLKVTRTCMEADAPFHLETEVLN